MCTGGGGGGGSTTGNVQRSKPTWLKRPVYNVFLSKRSFRKRERQGLAGSVRNRPTCGARLRSRTTASSGMRHIASSCTSYTHVYLATRGCQCSLGMSKQFIECTPPPPPPPPCTIFISWFWEIKQENL